MSEIRPGIRAGANWLGRDDALIFAPAFDACELRLARTTAQACGTIGAKAGLRVRGEDVTHAR